MTTTFSAHLHMLIDDPPRDGTIQARIHDDTTFVTFRVAGPRDASVTVSGSSTAVASLLIEAVEHVIGVVDDEQGELAELLDLVVAARIAVIERMQELED